MSKNTFDLQIQSTASDGKHAPAEIVVMAREERIEVIAITDHDSVGGVAEAQKAGKEAGVRVIPGIEMSVEEHGAHILGYGLNSEHPKLLEELRIFHQGRIEGAKQMLENLKRAGFVVEWEDVEKQARGVVARPHLARAVLARAENKEKLGSVSNVHDFIEAYLTDDSPNYVKRGHISAKDGIALIHGAGGVAVWSHPAIHFRPVKSRSAPASGVAAQAEHISHDVGTNYEALEEFLKSLIEWGIDGLEVFNPSHTEDDAEYIQNMATRYRLLRTAGSDFHEKGEHPANEQGLHSARILGDYETYGFDVSDVIARLDEAMQRRAFMFAEASI